MSARDVLPASGFDGTCSALSASSFAATDEFNGESLPPKEKSTSLGNGQPVLPLQRHRKDMVLNGTASTFLLDKVSANLQRGDSRHGSEYGQGCLCQLSLMVQFARDPFAFGIINPAESENEEAFQQYRLAVVEVLWYLAWANELTCDLIHAETIILGDLANAARDRDLQALVEGGELDTRKSATATFSLPTSRSIKPTVVVTTQSDTQALSHEALSDRLHETYQRLIMPSSEIGSRSSIPTRQTASSSITVSIALDFDPRRWEEYHSKERRKKWQSLQKGSSDRALRKRLGGGAEILIKGLPGKHRIEQIRWRLGGMDPRGMVAHLEILLDSVLEPWSFQLTEWPDQVSDSALWTRRKCYADQVALTIWAGAEVADVKYEEIMAELPLLRRRAREKLGLDLPDPDTVWPDDYPREDNKARSQDSSASILPTLTESEYRAQLQRQKWAFWQRQAEQRPSEASRRKAKSKGAKPGSSQKSDN